MYRVLDANFSSLVSLEEDRGLRDTPPSENVMMREMMLSGALLEVEAMVRANARRSS
jgi:hypothetical protein